MANQCVEWRERLSQLDAHMRGLKDRLPSDGHEDASEHVRKYHDQLADALNKLALLEHMQGACGEDSSSMPTLCRSTPEASGMFEKDCFFQAPAKRRVSCGGVAKTRCGLLYVQHIDSRSPQQRFAHLTHDRITLYRSEKHYAKKSPPIGSIMLDHVSRMEYTMLMMNQQNDQGFLFTMQNDYEHVILLSLRNGKNNLMLWPVVVDEGLPWRDDLFFNYNLAMRANINDKLKDVLMQGWLMLIDNDTENQESESENMPKEAFKRNSECWGVLTKECLSIYAEPKTQEPMARFNLEDVLLEIVADLDEQNAVQNTRSAPPSPPPLRTVRHSVFIDYEADQVKFAKASLHNNPNANQFKLHFPDGRVLNFLCPTAPYATSEYWLGVLSTICSRLPSTKSPFELLMQEVLNMPDPLPILEMNLDVLGFSFTPADVPLTLMPTQRLARESVTLFKALLLYSGTSIPSLGHDYHVSLCQSVSKKCLSNFPFLQYEFLLHLSKQTLKRRRGLMDMQVWQLFAICLGVFGSGSTIEMQQLRHYLVIEMKFLRPLYEDSGVERYIDYCLRLMDHYSTMDTVNFRQFSASRHEIESIINLNHGFDVLTHATVILPDSLPVLVPITVTSTASNVLAFVYKNYQKNGCTFQFIDRLYIYYLDPRLVANTSNNSTSGNLLDSLILVNDDRPIMDIFMEYEETRSEIPDSTLPQFPEFRVRAWPALFTPPELDGHRLTKALIWQTNPFVLDLTASDFSNRCSTVLEDLDNKPPFHFAQMVGFWEQTKNVMSYEEKMIFFFQTYDSIASGYFPMTHSAALYLAALRLQFEKGDHFPLLDSSPRTLIHGLTYLPPSISPEPEKEWVSKLSDTWVSLRGRTKRQCVELVLELTSRWGWSWSQFYPCRLDSRHTTKKKKSFFLSTLFHKNRVKSSSSSSLSQSHPDQRPTDNDRPNVLIISSRSIGLLEKATPLVVVPYEFLVHVGYHDGKLRILSTREEYTPPAIHKIDGQFRTPEDLIGQMSVIVDRVEVEMDKRHAEEVVRVVQAMGDKE